MSEILDTVLLLALPASGKSEVRRYLAHLDPETAARDFHMGPTVQLDDFPYVHLMRCIDDALESVGGPRQFFAAPDQTLTDGRDWGTLIELLNEDYDDLVAKRPHDVPSAASHFMARLDRASGKVGLPGRMAGLPAQHRQAVESAIEAEARQQLDDKLAGYPDTLDGKTLVVEFARGGADGSEMPLPAPFGYRYSLGCLSPALLARAKILYIWVTPEESRRKNEARSNPDDPGSILHHGVPHSVMMDAYGCDDMDWLESQAQPGTIEIEKSGQRYPIPIARFDNRQDRTTFVRESPSEWAREDVRALHDGLKGALDRLVG